MIKNQPFRKLPPNNYTYYVWKYYDQIFLNNVGKYRTCFQDIHETSKILEKGKIIRSHTWVLFDIKQTYPKILRWDRVFFKAYRTYITDKQTWEEKVSLSNIKLLWIYTYNPLIIQTLNGANKPLYERQYITKPQRRLNIIESGVRSIVKILKNIWTNLWSIE